MKTMLLAMLGQKAMGLAVALLAAVAASVCQAEPVIRLNGTIDPVGLSFQTTTLPIGVSEITGVSGSWYGRSVLGIDPMQHNDLPKLYLPLSSGSSGFNLFFDIPALNHLVDINLAIQPGIGVLRDAMVSYINYGPTDQFYGYFVGTVSVSGTPSIPSVPEPSSLVLLVGLVGMIATYKLVNRAAPTSMA